MRQKLCFFMLLGLLVVDSGCQSASSVAARSIPVASNAGQVCRQTIQELYSLETYCPDDLSALQNLFTEDFNRQNKLTLERCTDVSSYKVLTLLSENESGFFNNPDDSKLPGTIEYLAKIAITSKSGNSLGNNPALVWLHMKTDDTGNCKIDSIHGGG